MPTPHPAALAAITAMATSLVLVASPARASGVVEIEWNAAGSFDRQLTVPAGKFAEVCGQLTAPSAVAWTFDADAPLDFNVHYHQGQQVTYPAKRSAVRQGRDTLKVETPQDYCWMWANRSGRDARLRLVLSLQRP